MPTPIVSRKGSPPSLGIAAGLPIVGPAPLSAGSRGIVDVGDCACHLASADEATVGNRLEQNRESQG